MLNESREAARRRSLLKVSAKLKELSTATERDFLAVGGQLESIVMRTRQESAALGGLMNGFSGEYGQSLTRTLDHVAQWADEARQSADAEQSLAGLLRVVRQVSAPLRNLKASLQILRAMGLTMFVESVRLGPEAESFEGLAGEVRVLASSIDSKSNAVLDAVAALTDLLQRTETAEARLGRDQRQKLVRLTAESSAGLGDLQAEQADIDGISSSAKEGYDQVEKGIANLVVSLQFHDSARQRIEHVDEVLTALAGNGKDPADASATGGSAAVQVLELQAAQLSSASHAFQGVVGAIRADLQQLGATAEGFSGMARHLTGNTGRAGSFAESMEDHLTQVGKAVVEWSTSRTALGRAAAQVHDSCQQMSGLVAEVEVIGKHMFRLALNAEVQAFQMSASGVVMIAVADNIRSVCLDASEMAGAVGHALRELQAVAGGLVELLRWDLEADTQRADEMAAQIGEAVAELRAKNAEGRRVLSSIGDGGAALVKDISQLREHLTADRVMAEVTAACLGALENIAARARAAAGDHDAELPAGKLHEEIMQAASQSYTMHAEREVHAALGLGGGAVPAAVIAAAGPAESGLGDNVELF